MSASKDPEALARAKAKAADTRRVRPIRELRHEAEQTAKHFWSSAPKGSYDLDVLGKIIHAAADLARKVPFDAAQFNRLKMIEAALFAVRYPDHASAIAVTVDTNGVCELIAAIEKQTGRRFFQPSERVPPTREQTAEDDAVADALLAKFTKKTEGGAP